MTPDEKKKYDRAAKQVERIEDELMRLDDEMARLEKARREHVKVMMAIDGRRLYKQDEN